MVVTRKKPRRPKRAVVPLCPAADQHLRQMLNARASCSDAWSREIIAWIDAGRVDLFVNDQGYLTADFAKVRKALRRAGCYPPGGVLTLMKPCPACGRLTPNTHHAKENYPSDADAPAREPCEDCHLAALPAHVVAQFPASPSAHAIQQAGVRGAKISWQTTRLGRPKGRGHNSAG